MGIHMDSVAAGVGGNLLADKWIEYSKYPRRVARVGLVGSVDITDFPGGIKLKYGDHEVATLYLTTYGAVGVTDDDMQVITSKQMCPPNTAIGLWLPEGTTIDTNPLRLVVETQEFVRRFPRGNRWSKAGIGLQSVFTTAVQAVDTDLLSGKAYKVSDRDRRLSRVAFAGGAAIGDAGVDVSFGSEQVMHLINMNATATLPKTKWFWHSSQLVIPASVPLNVKVVDALTADDYLLGLDIKEA